MEKKVVMGSDPHITPYGVELSSLRDRTVISQWDTRFCHTLRESEVVYCWRMNDKYYAVVYVPADRCYYVCAQYKFYSSFKKWLERFYPQACLVEGR